MVRSKKVSPTEAPELTESFWGQFNLRPDASNRDKMLYLTLSEISRRGILDVNARWLCDVLGVDYSLVNYHFGSFDGLLAEVFVLAHDLWAHSISTALQYPSKSAEDRLRRVIDAEVARAKQYGAVVGVSLLPHVSEQVSEILDTKYPQRLSNVVAYTVCVVAALIHDLRTDDATPIKFDHYAPPIDAFMADYPAEVRAAIQVQWALVGPTLWMTGAGGGGADIEALPQAFTGAAIWAEFTDRLVESVKRDFTAK
jgi:AcrR family transcriptional regulator